MTININTEFTDLNKLELRFELENHELYAGSPQKIRMSAALKFATRSWQVCKHFFYISMRIAIKPLLLRFTFFYKAMEVY